MIIKEPLGYWAIDEKYNSNDEKYISKKEIVAFDNNKSGLYEYDVVKNQETDDRYVILRAANDSFYLVSIDSIKKTKSIKVLPILETKKLMNCYISDLEQNDLRMYVSRNNIINLLNKEVKDIKSEKIKLLYERNRVASAQIIQKTTNKDYEDCAVKSDKAIKSYQKNNAKLIRKIGYDKYN